MEPSDTVKVRYASAQSGTQWFSMDVRNSNGDIVATVSLHLSKEQVQQFFESTAEAKMDFTVDKGRG